MTKEEIIDMARKSDFEIHSDNLISFDGIDCTSELIAFAKLVAEKSIEEALAQPEQKYHRGDRLICLETEEYCVIHISGTDRQWVKFPDSHIGVYTNEQVAELFELLPKDPEQGPVAWITPDGEGFRIRFSPPVNDVPLGWVPLYTAPPQRKPLSDEQIDNLWDGHVVPMFGKNGINPIVFARAIEAAHGIKGN